MTKLTHITREDATQHPPKPQPSPDTYTRGSTVLYFFHSPVSLIDTSRAGGSNNSHVMTNNSQEQTHFTSITRVSTIILGGG